MEVNFFDLLSKEWMLITAENAEKVNTMTASWGGFGVLWGKNVSFIFVRPQRYTFEFLNNSNFYSLCFFSNEHRNILEYCGGNSGRDKDKIKHLNLKVVKDSECPYFEQANLVFICKKLYFQDITPENFSDIHLDKNYLNKDYHRVFVGEIKKILTK
ncbi:MAG: flavin reductase [Candidatus Paraimprobicoccus trichonymphae]|uniref:Flavin reductase n=1 Tax=Candidatus Paraimprobicoccus trichonymphae TaxID=3033793 RepID=A0AA48I968_9FIRM|nr:MAG: flavin reductase [Candidatus Paraimprobicoccus trichonymphae]